MLVEMGPWRAAKACPSMGQAVKPIHIEAQNSDFALDAPDFSGSYASWCEEGFSICEGYLIEAQNFFLLGKLDGFLAMARAQFDTELENETLTHANTLLVGVAFRRLGNEVRAVEARPDSAGLNWLNIVNLYRAMDTTKGDMRMPRLHPAFDKILRKAMVLS